MKNPTKNELTNIALPLLSFVLGLVLALALFLLALVLGMPDDRLTDLFVEHSPPGHVRSDQGPEFIANAVRTWLARIGVRTLYIEKASPWENGDNESFNSKLRDELLNGEIFYTLKEAQVPIEAWRHHDNTQRPHSSLAYRPPAPETIALPRWPLGSAPLRLALSVASERRLI